MNSIDTTMASVHDEEVVKMVRLLDNMVGDCRDLIGMADHSSVPPEVKARIIGNAHAAKLLLGSSESALSVFAFEGTEGDE